MAGGSRMSDDYEIPNRYLWMYWTEFMDASRDDKSVGGLHPVQLLIGDLGRPETVGTPMAGNAIVVWGSSITETRAKAVKEWLRTKHQIEIHYQKGYPDKVPAPRALSWHQAMKEAEEYGKAYEEYAPEQFSQGNEAITAMDDMRALAKRALRRKHHDTAEEYEEAIQDGAETLYNAMYDYVGTKLSADANAEIDAEVKRLLALPDSPDKLQTIERYARELEEMPETDEYVTQLFDFIQARTGVEVKENPIQQDGGNMEWQDNPDCMKALAAIDQSLWVEVDEEMGLVFSWQGGHGVHVYNEDGKEIDYWSVGDFAKDAATLSQVKESIADRRSGEPEAAENPRRTKAEVEEALQSLHKLLKPGDVVYTSVGHVARSGMMREISVYIIRNNQLRNITGLVGTVIGLSRGKSDGLRVGGAGMDMGFHVVYSLASMMFRAGFDCAGDDCPSNDHSNAWNDVRSGICPVDGRPIPDGSPYQRSNGGRSMVTVCSPECETKVWHHRDGGYALKQLWMSSAEENPTEQHREGEGWLAAARRRAELVVPDRIDARNRLDEYTPTQYEQRPPMELAAPLLHGMLASAITSGYVHGSIGSEEIEQVGDFEYSVKYLIKRKKRGPWQNPHGDAPSESVPGVWNVWVRDINKHFTEVDVRDVEHSIERMILADLYQNSKELEDDFTVRNPQGRLHGVNTKVLAEVNLYPLSSERYGLQHPGENPISYKRMEQAIMRAADAAVSKRARGEDYGREEAMAWALLYQSLTLQEVRTFRNKAPNVAYWIEHHGAVGDDRQQAAFDEINKYRPGADSNPDDWFDERRATEDWRQLKIGAKRGWKKSKKFGKRFGKRAGVGLEEAWSGEKADENPPVIYPAGSNFLPMSNPHEDFREAHNVSPY